jgi:CheY-like chemotaxis protein
MVLEILVCVEEIRDMKVKTLVLGNNSIMQAVTNSLIASGSEVVRLYEIPETITVLKHEQLDLVVLDGALEDLVNTCFRLIWICRLRVLVATSEIQSIYKELQPLGIEGYIGAQNEQNEFTTRITAIAQKGSIQFDKINVVLIEDDKHIQDAIKLFFQILWPEVNLTVCRDGRNGISETEKKIPDIILLDLGLPDMDGFEVLSRIRLSSRVPIVILTGQRDKEQIIRAMQSGADDYIVKPFKQIDLMLRVKKTVNLGRLQSLWAQ